MNILIINQPPYNRGDESAHKALIRELLKRLPDCKIHVLSDVTLSESVRQYRIVDERVDYLTCPIAYGKASKYREQGMKKDKMLPWYFNMYFRQYKGYYYWADVVVCAPGGICMGGFQDWNHLFHLVLAKFFKKPLAYYGRSFGPFPEETELNRRFKELSLRMLHYFDFLAIRDHKTELLAEELKIPYISTVDTAFLDSPMVKIPYEINSAIGTSPYVVFVPNYLLWHYVYKGKVRHEQIMSFYLRILKDLLDTYEDCNVVMLPQLFCGRKYELSDVEFFRDLAEEANTSRIIVLPDCYSSDIQQQLINGAKFLIGSRYHSIVFAINQCVPFVALSYEHKIAGLLDTIGLSERCVDIVETFNSKVNEENTLNSIHEKMMIRTRPTEARLKAKSIASECMNKFIEKFK